MIKLLRAFVLFFSLFTSVTALGYRIEAGDLFVGGGFGVNVNVARMEKPTKTPGAELPLWIGTDYLFDANWGVFGSVIPSFSVGSFGLGMRAGVKYWFTQFDLPFFPYASLALSPSFLILKDANHFNIGLSPGGGVYYFIVAKFMVGAHVHFNPSLAFGGSEKKFEFSVMPFFDLSLRL